MLPPFTYLRADSLDTAIARSQPPEAVVFAGGTDVLGCLRDGVFAADTVVSIGGLDELRGIRQTDNGGLRIGALATLAEIARHPLVVERYTALAQGAAAAASPQIRNQGTLGGNLCQRPRCWYFRGDFHCRRKGGDTCYAILGENQYHCIFGGEGCYIVHPSDTAPTLVALDATVRLASASGTRSVPAASFFVPPGVDVRRETALRPGEILTEVVLPAVPANHRSIYRKARARGAWDFALAGAAIALRGTERVEHARVVLSGVAPIPWRAGAAEEALNGRRLDTETIGRAAAASVADARPMTQNGYKVELARGVVQEALELLAQA